MFTINDGYINALTEALENPKSKYKQNDELTEDDLLISNIPDLYNCEWILEFTDLVVCEHCHSVMKEEEIELQTREVEYDVDAWSYSREEPYQYTETGEEDYEACPSCGIGEDEDEEFVYYPLDTETLFDDIDKLKYLQDYAEKGFVEAVKKYLAEQNDTEIKTEAKEEKQKPEKDDEDFTKLKDTVKKEMYKYLKSNGIDIDHLIKSGVELNNMKPVIDKMLDTYVATSIADYENEFNIGLAWDYKIDNNDIIITIETM